MSKPRLHIRFTIKTVPGLLVAGAIVLLSAWSGLLGAGSVLANTTVSAPILAAAGEVAEVAFILLLLGLLVYFLRGPRRRSDSD